MSPLSHPAEQARGAETWCVPTRAQPETGSQTRGHTTNQGHTSCRQRAVFGDMSQNRNIPCKSPSLLSAILSVPRLTVPVPKATEATGSQHRTDPSQGLLCPRFTHPIHPTSDRPRTGTRQSDSRPREHHGGKPCPGRKVLRFPLPSITESAQLAVAVLRLHPSSATADIPASQPGIHRYSSGIHYSQDRKSTRLNSSRRT